MHYKNIIKSALILLTAALIAISASARATPLKLTIVHVNDTHSHMEPAQMALLLGGQKTYVSVGGYARLATLVKQTRSSNQPMLLLHAGDAVQGDMSFIKYEGVSDIDFMNKLAFDAMAVGNHEFDRGPKLLARLIRQADFPFLSANLDATRDSNLNNMIKPYLIKEIAGQKIGIIGLTVAETQMLSSPGPDVVFQNVIIATRNAVKVLEGQGVKHIIVLSHISYAADLRLAAEVPGIDLIVGGHSHTLLGNFGRLGLKPQGPYPVAVKGPDEDDVYVVQSWEWAKVAGVLNISFDSAGRIKACNGDAFLLVGDSFYRKNDAGRMVLVDNEDKQPILADIAKNPMIKVLPEDAGMLKKLALYRSGIEELRNKEIARATEDLLHIREPGLHINAGVNLPEGSSIAPIVAEAMLWKMNQVGLDVQLSLQNAGGVRTDIHQGPLTVARVYSILPFNNTLVVLTLTGAQIRAALEHGVTRGGGSFPYLGGARYTADMRQPQGRRITELEVRGVIDKWSPVVDDKTYRLATISFLAGGGGGYTVLKNAADSYDTGFVDAEVFMEYAAELGELTMPKDTGVRVKR